MPAHLRGGAASDTYASPSEPQAVALRPGLERTGVHMTIVPIGIAVLDDGVPALAQDADLMAEGEKVFKRCAACHKIGEGAKNGVGPR